MKPVESISADRLTQFSPETWAELLRLAQIFEAATGDLIFKAGDVDNRLVIVLSGRVALMRSQNTRAGIFLSRGETIGGSSSQLMVPKPYGSVAIEDSTRLLSLTRDEILELCTSSREFLDFVLQDLAHQVQRTIKFLQQERSMPIEQRLANRLLEIGALNKTVDLTQDELAKVVGTSRVSIAKLLSKFETAGLIRRLYKQISILDLDGLAAVADAD